MVGRGKERNRITLGQDKSGVLGMSGLPQLSGVSFIIAYWIGFAPLLNMIRYIPDHAIRRQQWNTQRPSHFSYLAEMSSVATKF
jgi:hypothetical protein